MVDAKGKAYNGDIKRAREDAKKAHPLIRVNEGDHVFYVNQRDEHGQPIPEKRSLFFKKLNDAITNARTMETFMLGARSKKRKDRVEEQSHRKNKRGKTRSQEGAGTPLTAVEEDAIGRMCFYVQYLLGFFKLELVWLQNEGTMADCVLRRTDVKLTADTKVMMIQYKAGRPSQQIHNHTGFNHVYNYTEKVVMCFMRLEDHDKIPNAFRCWIAAYEEVVKLRPSQTATKLTINIQPGTKYDVLNVCSGANPATNMDDIALGVAQKLKTLFEQFENENLLVSYEEACTPVSVNQQREQDIRRQMVELQKAKEPGFTHRAPVGNNTQIDIHLSSFELFGTDKEQRVQEKIATIERRPSSDRMNIRFWCWLTKQAGKINGKRTSMPYEHTDNVDFFMFHLTNKLKVKEDGTNEKLRLVASAIVSKDVLVEQGYVSSATLEGRSTITLMPPKRVWTALGFEDEYTWKKTSARGRHNSPLDWTTDETLIKWVIY